MFFEREMMHDARENREALLGMNYILTRAWDQQSSADIIQINSNAPVKYGIF